jgi:hypothetical protein
MYAGQLKANHVYLKKSVVQGLYDRVYLAKFVCSCISLSGPFYLLQEPLFDLNKSILGLFFLPGFSKGSLPKNIGVHV